ncbi:MAG: Uma2 family endonuclease [Spirulinaceae cyanobacterium RM2_2_10]|nr:Uma2 family endonuclease [Spirulinaceae cyanobacterium SM2_1_0]NJO19898.1 Uma2 family endonuclease [Spirulinaceae cyanobacterium RM2_2_10]
MQLATHKFTADQYQKMGEAGIFHPEARLELIQGDILVMSPIGLKHAATVNRLANLLPRLVGDRTIVSIQNSIRLNDYSEPQPDVVLLQPRADFYESQIPQPDNVLLLIEIADSSLRYDRRVKAPLYAENNIQEFWLINLLDQTLECYRQPQAEAYTDQQTLNRDQAIAPLAFPDLTLNLTQILG